MPTVKAFLEAFGLESKRELKVDRHSQLLKSVKIFKVASTHDVLTKNYEYGFQITLSLSVIWTTPQDAADVADAEAAKHADVKHDPQHVLDLVNTLFVPTKQEQVASQFGNWYTCQIKSWKIVSKSMDRTLITVQGNGHAIRTMQFHNSQK
jgi:hypothetical protein